MIRRIFWLVGDLRPGKLISLLSLLPYLSCAQYLPVRSYDKIPQSRTETISLDSEDTIWLGNASGLYRTVSRDSASVHISDRYIDLLAFAHDDFLFIANGDSLLIYEKPTDRLQAPIFTFKLPCYTDRYGDQGVNAVRQIETVIDKPQAYVIGEYGIFVFTYSETLGTWKEEAKYLNKLDQEEYAFPFLGNMRINAIRFENPNRIWLATDTGLHLWDGNDQVLTVLPDITISSVARVIPISSKYNRIWAVGREGFLTKKIWGISYPKEGSLRRRHIEAIDIALDSSLDGYPYSIETSPRGDVWVGMDQVIRYRDLARTRRPTTEDISKTFRVYGAAEGFLAREAISFCPDRAGFIWVGTSKGVVTVKPSVFLRKIAADSVRCFGDRNGAFTVKVVDGQPPYRLILDSIPFVPSALGPDSVSYHHLGPGRYKVLATDSLRKDTAIIVVQLMEPDPLQAIVRKYRPPSFVANRDGVARVENASGGRVTSVYSPRLKREIGNYQFIWSNARDTSSSSTNNALGINDFSVVVMDTMGCSLLLRDTFFSTAKLPEMWQRKIEGQGDVLLNEGGHLLFGNNSYTVQEKDMLLLEEVAMFINNHKEARIEVRGHTDVVAADKVQGNRELSRKRAKAVADVLISKGVDPYQIRVKGMGFSELLYDADQSSQRRKRNQRAEIWLINE